MNKLLMMIGIMLASATALMAQPLTDRVPADALVYVGWRGTEALGTTYDNSRLAEVLNSSKLADAWNASLTQIIAKIPQDNPETSANVQAALPLLALVWKRPTALFFAPGVDQRGDFEPKFGVICDAGNAAADVYKSLSSMTAQAGKGKSPIHTAIDGHLVALTIGYDDAAAAIKPPAPLNASTIFKNTMQAVDAEPVYTLYIDIERALAAIDQDVAKGRDKKAAANWPKISQSLGLAGLKRFAMTGAFDGRDWSSRMFLDAPNPRTGIVSLLDNAPINDKSLAAIPQTAAYAMIGQFDIGKLFAQIKNAVNAGGADAAREFNNGLAQISQRTGLDVPRLMASFGNEWTMYADKGVGGVTQQGLVISNTLTDAPQVEAALDKLLGMIKQYVAQNQTPVQIQDVQIGDHLTVHSVSTFQGGVNWIVKDGKLFIGFKPETVGAATLVGTQVAPPNLSGNAKFADVKKRLGADQISGFQFADLPQTVVLRDTEMRQVLPLIAMMASGAGIMIPPDLLPKLEVVKANVFPSGTVSWSDKTGWHSRSISPFPFSSIYSSQQVDLISVGGAAMSISILLPSLNRARETANRVKCASNERQIGQAILLYSNDHRGKYPPDLGALIKEEDITPEVFTCPSSDNSVPSEIATGTKDAQADWVNKSSSYIYVGKGMNNSAGADVVVVYEKSDDHDKDGLNFLWGDGHVSWESMPTAEQLIKTSGSVQSPPPKP